MVDVERILVFEQCVVHCPEGVVPSVFGDRLRGFRCDLRVRMDLGEREVRKMNRT